MTADWTTKKRAHTHLWSEGKKTRIYLAKTLAGRFQFNVMRQYQATLAVVSLDGFVLNVAMCECMSKIPARKKHNMVQRVNEERYKKNQSTVYPFIPSEWAWNLFDIFPSLYAIQRQTHTRTHPIIIWHCIV